MAKSWRSSNPNFLMEPLRNKSRSIVIEGESKPFFDAAALMLSAAENALFFPLFSTSIYFMIILSKIPHFYHYINRPGNKKILIFRSAGAMTCPKIRIASAPPKPSVSWLIIRLPLAALLTEILHAAFNHDRPFFITRVFLTGIFCLAPGIYFPKKDHRFIF
jgi:hypothetical protein